METDWLTLNELYEAYLDCRRHKASTDAHCEFMMNRAMNLYSLYEDLVDGTYTIGKSIAFCVTSPKVREVFAANFRDRIVHHFLILRYGELLDKSFIDDTYNCRKGKGNYYGAKRLYDVMQEYLDYWTVKMDMQGFFYSINKQLLYDKLEAFLKENYKRDDLDKILWLTKMVVMHRPQDNCEKRGDNSKWSQLPKDRSLFTCKDGYGMAIGNLTSQIFANFYLKDFDDAMFARYGYRYRRYVDDFTVTGTHEEVLEAIEFARRYLLEHLGIRLHKKKISIQPVKNGITFIGFGIKRNRLYTGTRTIYHALQMVDDYNLIANSNEEDIPKWVEMFEQRMNSYLGFLVHTKSYNYRKKIFDNLDDKIKHYIDIQKDYKNVHVKKEYTKKEQLKKDYYGKKNIHKKRMERS